MHEFHAHPAENIKTKRPQKTFHTDDILTSGGTSGSGQTSLLSSALSTSQLWGDFSEDCDASGNDANLSTNRSVRGDASLGRLEPKWPPTAKKLSGGDSASPYVAPGSLPEWHAVEAETPSDDDRYWAASSSSANTTPRPIMACPREAYSRRRPAAHGFSASSALVPADALSDVFASSAFESADALSCKSDMLRQVILSKQGHHSKHRHRRLPGRRRCLKEALHIMESCSEAPEECTEDAHSCESAEAQTFATTLAWIFAPLFDLRATHGDAETPANSSAAFDVSEGAGRTAQLNSLWCEAGVLSPTDDEQGWAPHSRPSFR